MALQRALQFASQRAAVARRIQRDVVHLHAALTQLRGKVAHGRQHQHDLLGMVRHITALGLHLGHQHHIALGIQALQRRQAVTQLVAQHQPQRAAHRAARQRSEQ